MGFRVGLTNVHWLNLYPKTVRHGAMWDQEIVHWLLSPKPWTDEHATPTILHQQGAIVVIAGRFHDTDLERINQLVSHEPWVVYVITSDEENAFDVDRLAHPNRKVWVQTPQPGKHDQYGWLPVGWTPHVQFADGMIGEPKALDWYFAGQITHSRRVELAEVLRTLPGGQLVETPGFTQGVSPQEYIASMAVAKVAPCPSGPITVDTFRLCEALEVGAIPVVETYTPEKDMGAYWFRMFGDFNLPIVESWHDFPERLADLLYYWPETAAELGADWITWKRNLHRRFWADVKAVRG